MEKSVKENNNSGIIIAILCILLLASVIFICCDKFLKKEKIKQTDCNCPICEKCNKEADKDIETEKCVLDMNGKTSLEVNRECANNSNVVIKNIISSGNNYELTYIFSEDENSSNSQLAYDNGVTRIYVNGKLIDAFPGASRNGLMTIKISNNKLVLGEAYPSEEPTVEHTYDLSDYF